MTAALDRCTALAAEPQIQAFFHVIGAGETNAELDERAYRMVNGGALFDAPPWRHPYHGIPTTQGGKACGFAQFLGTTWAEIDRALGLNGDFSPGAQRAGAVWLIDTKRHALPEVLSGDVLAAAAKLRDEWVSLPGLGAERIKRVFAQFGGVRKSQGTHETPPDIATPTPKPKPTPTPDLPTSERTPMGALALLQLFGPILSGLVPQIATLLDPKSEVAKRNVGIGQLVLDTIVQTAGAPNLQGAIESMKSDPEVQKKVQAAIVSEPTIIGLLEVGAGGIAAARDYGVTIQNAEKPFWYNPTFWISMGFFPMMYMITFAVLFMTDNGLPEGPWYTILGFEDNTRSGLVNLIVGFVFGGVVGVWFGTSYGSQRKTELAASATGQAVDKA